MGSDERVIERDCNTCQYHLQAQTKEQRESMAWLCGPCFKDPKLPYWTPWPDAMTPLITRMGFTYVIGIPEPKQTYLEKTIWKSLMSFAKTLSDFARRMFARPFPTYRQPEKFLRDWHITPNL